MNRSLFLPFLCGLILSICSQQASALQTNCVAEFETCYFHDCCEGFICTTNTKQDHLTANKKSSVCLSDRSIKLDEKSYDEKLGMIRHFYEDLVPPESRKSTDQVKQMIAGHHEAFAKLVSRLEKRYKMTIMDLNYDLEEL